jgi:hypothetical protein
VPSGWSFSFLLAVAVADLVQGKAPERFEREAALEQVAQPARGE